MKKMYKPIIGLTLAVAAMGLTACTKSLPYQPLGQGLKQDVISKSSIDENADYLYVPSTGAVSRTTDKAQPFMYAGEKIVHLKITQKSLQVYQTERDKNFTSNPLNSKLVMDIPITHIDYHCAQDRLGNCKNQEEENNDIPWNQKAGFRPDFSAVKVTEVSDMPDSINAILGKDACLAEASNKLMDYEFADDHLNFRIERTMTTQPNCLGSIQSLSDITTSMVANYHFVKLSSVASKDYESVNYPQTDENTFGFFKTSYNLTDVDNMLRTNGEVRMVNRWNPNRTEVVYYLSDEFNKPENLSLKKAAYIAFDKLNNGLKSSGAKFHLTLKDPAGLNPNDIRNSMIILVEDPVGGLLGYGPVTANPNTGEIISGRVAMFSGTMKSSARVSYEEIRNLKIAAKISGQSVAAVQQQAKTAELSKIIPKSKKSNNRVNKSLNKLSKMKGAAPSQANSGTQLTKQTSSNSSIKSLLNPNNSKDIKKYSAKLNTSDAVWTVNKHTCFYPEGMTEANSKVVAALERQFTSEMKAWEDLSDVEKQAALDIIMPELFEPILIHEMGHNLGLRHNFSGSEDAANFYTKDELTSMGVDYAIPYSSVMDYGASDLNVLPTLGKYDIAALKYAYGRTLIKKDGSELSIKSSDTIDDLTKAGGITLTDYKFCTDEAAEINAGCKRFDEGTTNVEIVNSIIDRYHEVVRLSGSRHDRENFSLMDDKVYAGKINNIFYDLRTFMEVVERIKYRAGIDDNGIGNDPSHHDYNKDPDYKDLHDAAVNAGNFLISILSMPETTCIIGEKANPSKAPDVIALSDIDSSAIHCADVQLIDRVVLLGEAGRPFLSKKDPNSNNPYVDQIDVRGMWMDKVLAAKYLFTRKIQETADQDESLFDENSDSFYNIPDLRQSMLTVLTGIMTDNFVANVDVTRTDGSTVKMDIPLSIVKSHVIPKHMDSALAKFLSVPDRDTHFIEVLGQRIARQNDQSSNRDSLAKELLDNVGIYKTPAIYGFASNNDVTSVAVNGKSYAANEDNSVAGSYIDQVTVFSVIKDLSVQATDAASMAQLLAKLTAARNPAPAADQTPPAALSPAPASGLPQSAPADGTTPPVVIAPAAPTTPAPAVVPAAPTAAEKEALALTDDQFKMLSEMITAGVDGNASASIIQALGRFMEMLPVLN